MPAHSPQGSSQPFGAHDYQIEYLPADVPREVNIRAKSAAPLQVGDRYTIGRPHCICDLIVEEISRPAGDRWTARCRVSDLLWL
jgi:hypothetical protein